MKRTLISIGLVFSLGAAAAAEQPPATPPRVTGQKLVDNCRSEDDGRRLMCIGFVLGVYRSMHMFGKACTVNVDKDVDVIDALVNNVVKVVETLPSGPTSDATAVVAA